MIAVFRRLLFAPIALFGVAVLSFLLIHLVPGDPADLLLGDQASAADKAALRAQLGIDQPITTQFAKYFSNLLQGDLGQSLVRQESVTAVIGERLPATLELGFAALIIAITIGIGVGVTAAANRGKLPDKLSRFFSLAGTSMPSFWIAPMLVFIFAIKLDWLPVSERGGIEHLILPSLTLAIGLAAVLSQVTRASILDVLKQDYITTARAKGATRSREIWRHALANAATPIVTVIGLQAGAVLTGTVIVETIFDWPGIGTLLLQSIHRRDYPMVQGCILTIAAIYVVVNIAIELIQIRLNPRSR